MSYKTWNVYGIGVNVSEIETDPHRLIKLAEESPDVLKDLREYLADKLGENYKDEDLTLDDFDEYEGSTFLDSGVTHVLFEVMQDLFGEIFECVDAYNCDSFILYIPSFPWGMTRDEKRLQEGDVIRMFTRCVNILTDEPVTIGYHDVECGG